MSERTESDVRVRLQVDTDVGELYDRLAQMDGRHRGREALHLMRMGLMFEKFVVSGAGAADRASSGVAPGPVIESTGSHAAGAEPAGSALPQPVAPHAAPEPMLSASDIGLDISFYSSATEDHDAAVA